MHVDELTKEKMLAEILTTISCDIPQLPHYISNSCLKTHGTYLNYYYTVL